MNNDSKSAPSRFWYFLSLFLLFLGPILGIGLLISSLAHSPKAQFTTVGAGQINITKPGAHSLLLSPARPGPYSAADKDANISFYDATTKKTITPLTGNIMALEVNHNSYGIVDFPHAGTYQIKTERFTPTEPYQVTVRQTPYLRLLLSFLLIPLGMISAVLLALITYARRVIAHHPAVGTDLVEPRQSSRMWAMFTHLSGFSGFFIAFANLLLPLLLWRFKRSESSYLDDQGKQALNFQFSMTIYYFIAFALVFVLIGLVLMLLLLIFNVICLILAAAASAKGKLYRYPLTIPFLR